MNIAPLAVARLARQRQARGQRPLFDCLPRQLEDVRIEALRKRHRTAGPIEARHGQRFRRARIGQGGVAGRHMGQRLLGNKPADLYTVHQDWRFGAHGKAVVPLQRDALGR